MKSSSFGQTEKEPPSASTIAALKEFKSAGRGFWTDVSDQDWNDWRWWSRGRNWKSEECGGRGTRVTVKAYFLRAFFYMQYCFGWSYCLMQTRVVYEDIIRVNIFCLSLKHSIISFSW